MLKVQVKISGLEARIIIGVYDTERAIKQKVVLNISFSYDASEAADSDDLNQAVDYHALEKKVYEFLLNSEFFLLERLADAVLKLVLEHNKIIEATVEIIKPEALDHSESVLVSVSGER